MSGLGGLSAELGFIGGQLKIIKYFQLDDLQRQVRMLSDISESAV